MLNKPRNSALKNRRFGRYMLYAFGEMVIIILGILAAMQLNNWNQERQEAEAFREQLLSFVDELRSNQITYGGYVQMADTADISFGLWLAEKLDMEELLNGPYARMTTTYFPFEPKTELLNSLLEKRSTWDEGSEEILDDIRDYSSRLEVARFQHAALREQVLGNIQYQTENHTWFGRSDAHSRRRFGQYLASDSLFRNRVLLHRILMVNNMGALTGELKVRAAEIELSIHRYLEAASMEELQESLDLSWAMLEEESENAPQPPAWDSLRLLPRLIVALNPLKDSVDIRLGSNENFSRLGSIGPESWNSFVVAPQMQFQLGRDEAWQTYWPEINSYVVAK